MDDPGQQLSLSEVLAMAVDLQQRGRLAEAEEMYLQILRAQPNQADALHFLGLLRHQTGHNQEAIGLMRQAVAAAPGYADAHNNLGNVLQLEGRLAEACLALRRVIELRPDHAAALNNLGVVLKEQGDLEGAVHAYRRAIALRPDDSDAYYNLGNALLALGNTGEAAQAWKQSVILQPAQANAWHQLGIFHKEQGKTEEARAAFEQAIRVNADLAAAHFELGHLLRKQGAAEQAVLAYRRTLALDPDCENARHYLAAVLEVLGRKDQAVQVWRDWLCHSPDHPVPRHMLAATSDAPMPDRAEDDYVRAVFDGFADKFERHLKSLEYRAPQWVAEAVAREFEFPGAALAVLDAGCGTGWCGPFLRPYAARLVGVDLSPGMLEKARAGRGYDELVEAELTEYLDRHPEAYDLIVSADTLVYFGSLDRVLQAARRALKPGGRLVFTLEAWDDSEPMGQGFKLHSRGRYSHRQDYVETSVTRAGLRVRSITTAPLRLEAGQVVAGWVVSARKGDGASAS